MPITSRPDHVAVAVPSLEDAAERWHDQLGGGYLEPRVVTEAAGFATCQLLYANNVKLELLEPTREDSFAQRFIDRFGAGVHHVTLTVEDLLPAVETVQAAGYDVVDVNTDDELWHEAFLRPSHAGGVIVQLAWSRYSMWEWAEHWNAQTGWQVEDPPRDGAGLLGPTLGNPDLDAAERLWTTLGATVQRERGSLAVTWDDATLSLRIEQAETAGPLGLRFVDAPELPEDARFGPSVIVGQDPPASG